MATIKQSVDINVPAHAACERLAQFEQYPRFMETVESVRQTDDTHLHWATTTANRPLICVRKSACVLFAISSLLSPLHQA